MEAASFELSLLFTLQILNYNVIAINISCFLLQQSVVTKLLLLSQKMKFTASQQILFAVFGIIFVAQDVQPTSPDLKVRWFFL